METIISFHLLCHQNQQIFLLSPQITLSSPYLLPQPWGAPPLHLDHGDIVPAHPWPQVLPIQGTLRSVPQILSLLPPYYPPGFSSARHFARWTFTQKFPFPTTSHSTQTLQPTYTQCLNSPEWAILQTSHILLSLLEMFFPLSSQENPPSNKARNNFPDPLRQKQLYPLLKPTGGWTHSFTVWIQMYPTSFSRASRSRVTSHLHFYPNTYVRGQAWWAFPEND